MAEPKPEQNIPLEEDEPGPLPGQAPTIIVNDNPIPTLMYAQWYADEAHDPFHQDYLVIMQSFAPENVMAPVVFLDWVLGNNNMPQAFLALTLVVTTADTIQNLVCYLIWYHLTSHCSCHCLCSDAFS